MSQDVAWPSITESSSDLTIGICKPPKIRYDEMQVGSLVGSVMGAKGVSQSASLRACKNLHILIFLNRTPTSALLMGMNFAAHKKMHGQNLHSKRDGSLTDISHSGTITCSAQQRWGGHSTSQDQAYLGLDWNRICDLGVEKISNVESLFYKDVCDI